MCCARVSISYTIRTPIRTEEHKYQPPYSRMKLPAYSKYPVDWSLGNYERVLHYLTDMTGRGKIIKAIEAMVRVMIIVSLDVEIQAQAIKLRTGLRAPVHIHAKDHCSFGTNSECRRKTLGQDGAM
jgi:hypothetical protein